MDNQDRPKTENAKIQKYKGPIKAGQRTKGRSRQREKYQKKYYKAGQRPRYKRQVKGNALIQTKGEVTGQIFEPPVAG